jgi:hypothetical protein
MRHKTNTKNTQTPKNQLVMKQITLKNDYQVSQLLQSIASNIIDWKANTGESKAKTMILKDLLDLAIDIEKQTGIKAYQETSIKSLFLDVHYSSTNNFDL